MYNKQVNFTEELNGFMRLKGQIEITSRFRRLDRKITRRRWLNYA